MTVHEMKAELGRLNAEIVTLKKQVVKIQQLITTNESYKFLARSRECESDLQQTLEVLTTISDKSDPSKPHQLVDAFQLFTHETDRYGYRNSRAAQDLAACEEVLQDLEATLLSKESERRQLYLALETRGLKESGNTVMFKDMSGKPAMPSPAPILKTPEDVFKQIVQYQKDRGPLERIFSKKPPLLPKVLQVKRLGQPTIEAAEVLRSRLTPGGQP